MLEKEAHSPVDCSAQPQIALIRHIPVYTLFGRPSTVRGVRHNGRISVLDGIAVCTPACAFRNELFKPPVQ